MRDQSKTKQTMTQKKVSLDDALEYAENIINTVREPLIVLDHNLRVVTASRSFYEFFKVKPEETVGQLIYNLGNDQWDIPKLRELLENILPQKTTFDNYEVEHDFVTIGRRIMLLNARQIERVLGKDKIILLAIEDITERKQIEAGLENTRKDLAVVKQSADEASEFAENIINTVREPLIALDQNLRVVKVSNSFYEFFKVKPEETEGQLIYNLGNKQWDIPKLRELLETILPQKATFENYEVEHEFATIGKRTMLLNARQIEQVLGKEKIILLAIEDITERKEIENGLEKTRKELAVVKQSADEASEFSENIINTVREPLIALDQNLRVVKVSDSFYEFFKVNPEDTVGQLIYDLGNKQWDIPKLRELLETILPQKATFENYEVEHEFATIGKRTMLLNARQIERVLGKEKIILLAIEDITERKRIESIGRLATVVRDSNDAITIQDYDGNITAWNHGAELMFGYSEQEALKMTIWQLAPPDKAAEQRDFNRQLFAGENVSSFETQRLTKDGILLDVWLTVTKLVDEMGKVTGIAATERDISERKKAELDLRRSNDDLQQFANVASHDLQEPLRMIVSYLQLIEQRYKGRLDKDADEFIDFAVDGGTRMQGLINGLLAFSRVESRSKPRERVDTEASLKDTLANLEVIISEHKADVTYDHLPSVMFDPSQLLQIFQNLIVNAIKFRGEETPRIHLAVEKKGREWVFSVKDNGIGIDPQYKDKVFILFHRLGGIKYHGSGVGLSVCKRIVERHGGRIWFESEPGKGTTFYFTVPG
jgi:PAS domain S-box-containing protein